MSLVYYMLSFLRHTVENVQMCYFGKNHLMLHRSVYYSTAVACVWIFSIITEFIIKEHEIGIRCTCNFNNSYDLIESML